MEPNVAMRRGWAVKYKNGSVVAEWVFGKPFSHLPNQLDIIDVGLFYGDRHWFIRGQKNYFAEKRESMLFGPSGVIGFRRIESRTIGFWDDKGRKIKFTVNELTGEATGPYLAEG
jgi:hypothetical protein